MTRQRPLHAARASASVGTSFCGISRILEAANIDRAQRCGVTVPDFGWIVSHFHQVAVMDDKNLPIGGFLHIELDEVGVLLGRKTKCGQCDSPARSPTNLDAQ